MSVRIGGHSIPHQNLLWNALVSSNKMKGHVGSSWIWSIRYTVPDVCRCNSCECDTRTHYNTFFLRETGDKPLEKFRSAENANTTTISCTLANTLWMLSSKNCLQTCAPGIGLDAIKPRVNRVHILPERRGNSYMFFERAPTAKESPEENDDWGGNPCDELQQGDKTHAIFNNYIFTTIYPNRRER